MAKKVFTKGHKKVGGKVKGSKNKKTLILETFANDIVDGGMQRFRTEMNKLKGSQYVNAFMTLFEYVKPKLARTEHTGKGGKELPPPIIVITTDEKTKIATMNLKKGGDN